MSNEELSYLAGLFDCKGKVAVTRGPAILRVTISDKREVLEEIRSHWCGRIIGCTLLLTGIFARNFLRDIQPYVKCSKHQVDYALEQWCKRKTANAAHKALIHKSATEMPARGC